MIRGSTVKSMSELSISYNEGKETKEEKITRKEHR